jgi:hypothetical protein
MAKFAITWSLGRVEHVVQEAAATVEEFLNIHFGSAWADAQDSGVKVELAAEQEAEYVTEQAKQAALEAAPAPEAPAAETVAPAEAAPVAPAADTAAPAPTV